MAFGRKAWIFAGPQAPLELILDSGHPCAVSRLSGPAHAVGSLCSQGCLDLPGNVYSPSFSWHPHTVLELSVPPSAPPASFLGTLSALTVFNAFLFNERVGAEAFGNSMRSVTASLFLSTVPQTYSLAVYTRKCH